MKPLFHLILPFLFLLPTGNHTIAEVTDKYISIEAAKKKGMLDVELYGLGGHQEECIEVKVNNLLADSLFIVIEPGRILESEDVNEQDIVIVKEKRIALGPLGKFVSKLFGFCGQSRNSAPGRGSVFHIGKMGDKALISVARLINKSNFPPAAVQHAIWVMTDDNPVSSIHDDKPERIKPLLNLVCKLKGIEIPWYTMIYEEDTAMLFSGRAQTLSATINYYISSNSTVHLNLRNEDGKIIRRFINGELHNPDKYTYKLKLNVTGWRSGKYYLNLYADENLKLKKMFELD